jgi:hypothetical protein
LRTAHPFFGKQKATIFILFGCKKRRQTTWQNTLCGKTSLEEKRDLEEPPPLPERQEKAKGTSSSRESRTRTFFLVVIIMGLELHIGGANQLPQEAFL